MRLGLGRVGLRMGGRTGRMHRYLGNGGKLS